MPSSQSSLPSLQDSLFYSGSSGTSSGTSTPKSPRKRANSRSQTRGMSTLQSVKVICAAPLRAADAANRFPDASPSPSRGSAVSKKSSSTTSPKQRRPHSCSNTSTGIPADKFKLHFAGRVYRPFEYTSPKKARKMYTTSGDWLGQPDELVDPHREDDIEGQGSETRCVCGAGREFAFFFCCR